MDPTVKKYPGQKNIPGVIQKIINQVPAHKVIIELFAGSASLSMVLSEYSNAEIILNDIDPDISKRYVVPRAIIYSLDALDLVQSKLITLAGKEAFVFIDPPYLHETRSNNKLYNYEMTDFMHVQLLISLKKLACNVMVIHPECQLYNYWLSGWRTVQIKIRYNNKTSIENLYMNYPEPDIIQSFQFLGADCWDRQRIKRKGDRLIKKLQSLNTKERNYLLDRIQAELLTT